MGGLPLLRVPVGPDAERWKTFRPGTDDGGDISDDSRTIIAVARTVTSTVRVLDVLPHAFRDDPRVQVVFAYDPTSAFHDGVHDLLHAVGARVMPWEQLPSIPCDLVVTATENADLTGTGKAPVLVLPHGVGFHKQVPDSRSTADRLSGAVPDELLDRAWLAISHPDQADQLAAQQPASRHRTLLVGDPCYDQLLAARPLRDRYRHALGLGDGTGDGRRLVLVSSTWGKQSLLGRQPGLPARLLGELPMDEYRVAMVTHPNVRSGHGSFEIRRLQSAAREAGLLLIPPTHGWQAALLASDLVIGDHGSVTLYGAALGKPVLLAAFGEESVPGTPMAELGRSAPRLAADEKLRAQVERAISNHRPEALARIGESAFAAPGRALELLRTEMYRLLALPEPPSGPPPVMAFADPQPETAPVTSAIVTTTVSGAGGIRDKDCTDGPGAAVGAGDTTVTMQRSPASVAARMEEAEGARREETEGEEAEGQFRNLACDIDERNLRLLQSASVLTRCEPMPTSVSAARWARETLARYPGSRIAAAPVTGGCCVAALWDGRTVEVSATGRLTDPGLLSAVVYACLRAGLPLDDRLVSVRIGARREDVALRLRAALSC